VQLRVTHELRLMANKGKELEGRTITGCERKGKL
jgi:hypothetical protein